MLVWEHFSFSDNIPTPRNLFAVCKGVHVSFGHEFDKIFKRFGCCDVRVSAGKFDERGGLLRHTRLTVS